MFVHVSEDTELFPWIIKNNFLEILDKDYSNLNNILWTYHWQLCDKKINKIL